MMLAAVLLANIIGLIIANPLPTNEVLASKAIPNLLEVIRQTQLNADVQERYVRADTPIKTSSYIIQRDDDNPNGKLVGGSVRIKKTPAPNQPPRPPSFKPPPPPRYNPPTTPRYKPTTPPRYNPPPTTTRPTTTTRRYTTYLPPATITTPKKPISTAVLCSLCAGMGK